MKTKKVIIYATTIILLSSGIKWQLFRNSAAKLNKRIETFTSNYESDDFLITAHRGFSSLEVENTRQAISLAAEKEYIDFIEVDVRMTKDGKLVLSHGNKILDVDYYTRYISSLTYDELMNMDFRYNTFLLSRMPFYSEENYLLFKRKLDLHNNIFHLTGLKEGLECCNNKKVLLDLKFNGNIEEFTNELLSELDGLDTSNIIMQSSNINGIRYIQDRTSFPCLALISNSMNFKYMNEFEQIGLPYSLVDYDTIDKIISEGKRVAIWTINDTEVLNELLAKVGKYYKDIIYITDCPDLILTRLHEIEETQEKRLKRIYN